MPHESQLLDPLPNLLTASGRCVAVVIGLENYQKHSPGGLPQVHYADRDAKGFADALRTIYPEERLEINLFTDNEATGSTINYTLLSVIGALTEDDCFIFYYAGHGFHDAGGNRITAWDSHAHHVEGTTLRLRDILTDRLVASKCRRALAFVDACATELTAIAPTRDVISDLNAAELKSFLKSATFNAFFLSCKPGQKSYPSDAHQHGVWTYFLLKALRGEDEKALGPGRSLTDVGLRDYLRKEVPRYITREMTVKGQQTPQAHITASNTFAIRDVPLRLVAMAEAGDLRRIKTSVKREYFEKVETDRIRSLPGFKKTHRVPTAKNSATVRFVLSLAAEQIKEELTALYDEVKTNFGLRSKDIIYDEGRGDGRIDTDTFRFKLFAEQDDDDPEYYTTTRQLELRDGAESVMAAIDETFGGMLSTLVVETNPRTLNFAEMVEVFEEIEEQHGGNLSEDRSLERLDYVPPGGGRISIDAKSGRMSISGRGNENISGLIAEARKYRFGLTGPAKLLLTN